MTPPCPAFPASELSLHAQADVNGKKRKLDGGANVDLSHCVLNELTQYRCFVDNPEVAQSPVRCWAVNRFFRQYVLHATRHPFVVRWHGTNQKRKFFSQTDARTRRELSMLKQQLGGVNMGEPTSIDYSERAKRIFRS